MTRKDYELIAKALENAKRDITGKGLPEHIADLLDGVNYAAEHLADALATTNAAFDRARFLKACGL